MKISDFLGVKITPENKQYDKIKNIKFCDDKNKVLVGNGTVTVHAFCEAFFDYVYRNYNSSRGAEKLIKSNRKKYPKFNGSECMMLVQRVLSEICDDYAISNYNIVCEIDSPARKKTVESEAAKTHANTVQQVKPAEVQKTVQNNTEITQKPQAAYTEETVHESIQAPVQNKPQTQQVNEINKKTANQPTESKKMQVLRSELERMQPQSQNLKDENGAHTGTGDKAYENVQVSNEPKPTIDNIRYGNTVNVVTDQSDKIPDVKIAVAPAAKPAAPQAVIKQNDGLTAKTPVSGAAGETKPANSPAANPMVSGAAGTAKPANGPAAKPMVPGAAGEAKPVNGPVAKPIESQAAVKTGNGTPQVCPPGHVMIDGKPVPINTSAGGTKVSHVVDTTENDIATMGLTGVIIAAENENRNKNNKDNKNKDKKNKDKKQEFPDARMKPGKGIPPIKDLKPVARFQNAGVSKSKLDLSNIPCIAVVEENIVPTMEEVPFIGISEDNSVPSISEVPFIGVDEGDDTALASADVETENVEPVADIVNIDMAENPEQIVSETTEYIEQEENILQPEPETAMEYFEAEGNVLQSEPETATEYIEPEDNLLQFEQEITAEYAESEENLPQPEPEAAIEYTEPAEYIEQSEPEAVAENAEAKPIADYQETVEEEAEQVSYEENAETAEEAENVVTSEDFEPAPSAVETEQKITEEAEQVKPEAIVKQFVSAGSQNIPAGKKKTGKRVIKDIKKIISSTIENNKQVVFTGPSGTGKTYQIRRFARRATAGYNGCQFVQFHPSFGYSDFIEGMRPANIINTTAPTNVRLDGVFKAFCRRIVEDNLEHAITGFISLYSEKKQKVLQNLYESIRERKEAIDEGLTTKYFDMDSPEYIFENGVREYYFIIDELNRADVAAVFGDVLFALDEDYRGIENRFDTILGNLKTYRIIQADDIGTANYTTTNIGYAEQMKFDCFERGFFIPKNLHIIGTMNEIENSADNIGFAFKHRFRWIDIDPEEIMYLSLKDIHRDKDIFWLDRFSENLNLVNRLIGESFSNEYRIGPAYFRKLDESADSINIVFDTTIEPLLKEYLKGKPSDITERFISECRRALHMGI